MKPENKKYIKSVIKKSGVGHLLTINLNNMPECRALCNAANMNNDKIDDSFILYFATSNHSPKTEQISKNKNTTVYYYLEDMENLTLFGKAEIITDKKIKDSVWQESWGEYYPNGGKNDPEYCIIKFTPESSKHYVVENGEYRKVEDRI